MEGRAAGVHVDQQLLHAVPANLAHLHHLHLRAQGLEAENGGTVGIQHMAVRLIHQCGEQGLLAVIVAI